MPTDLIQDFITFLLGLGLINGDGIDAFRDFMPDNPKEVVSVYEYQGHEQIPQIEGVHRSIQVVVRSASATTAKNKARQIYKVLNTETGIINFTPDRWCTVSLRQVPFKIKTDGNELVYYGFNIGITTYND